MITKDSNSIFKNTLVLDMFEIKKFLDFWTEYYPWIWNEDVLLCENINWVKESILDLVGLIPLKWKINDTYYDIMYNNIYNNTNKAIINIEKEYKDNLGKVVILNNIKDIDIVILKWNNEYETLTWKDFFSDSWFVPLFNFLDKDDYEKLEYWFLVNSIKKERILERWELYCSIEENIFYIEKNELNIGSYWDIHDYEDIISYLEYTIEENSNIEEFFINLNIHKVNDKKWYDLLLNFLKDNNIKIIKK